MRPATGSPAAGWDLAAVLAMRDDDLGDRFFLDLLTKIEREIGQAGNRTRHAMNGALIAIGLRNEGLPVGRDRGRGTDRSGRGRPR